MAGTHMESGDCRQRHCFPPRWNRPLAHKQEKPSQGIFSKFHPIPPSQILPTVHNIDMAAFIYLIFLKLTHLSKFIYVFFNY